MPQAIDVESLLVRLTEVGIALTSEQDLKKLLGQIVREARQLCQAEAGSLYLREGAGLRFVVAQNDILDRRERDVTSRVFESSLMPLSESSLAGYVGVTGNVLNLPDAYEIESTKPYQFNRAFDLKNDYRTRSILLVPMRAPQAGVIGVLQLINARGPDGEVIAFDQRLEGLMCSLASQAAVAVRNAQLTEQLKNAYRDTVIALSVAAEFRDKDTAAHIHRMSHYCKVIAEHMSLPSADVEIVLFASPMHDVGKLGVPDAILQKPGKLTEVEYKEMQNHTLYGERILSISDAEILRISREIAATHHEKWDGTGYPRRLKGETIPLFGRIAALADVFDALCSRRCYKDPMPIEQAVDIVTRDTGTHFDPVVVEAFLRGLPDILHYKQLYADDKLELGKL